MNEATPADQSGSDPGEVDRVEALEDQLRHLTTRLAGWVEAQLTQSVDDRRTELKALRSQLLADVDARLADAIPSAPAGADVGEVDARIEAFEQRVKAAMGRLTDSVEARLTETTAGRSTDLESLRSSLGDRLESVERNDAATAESLAALRLASRAAAERTEALEQQVKAAVVRLEKSVDGRLDAMVVQITAATEGVAALQAEAGAGPARTELLEQRLRSAMGRLAESVEARLAEVVERRQTELDTLRQSLEETLATQVSGARTEIGTAVADAHRRFVVSVDQLDERMTVVTEQAASARAAVERVEFLPDAVASDGRRIESLEEHTRRTDARLGELVDAKLAEVAGERLAEMAAARDQLRESVDAHLTDVRAEVAFTLGEGRTEVAAGTHRIEEAIAAIDTLGASVETTRRETEERLAEVVQVRLDELEKANAEVAEGRAEVAAAVAALDRRAADVEAQVRGQVEQMAVQVAGLVRTASTEGGVLAPLRADIRMLQERLTELTETVEQVRPRRKAPAPVKKAARRVLPPAPAAKVPAKKVPVVKKSAVRRRAQ